MDENRFWLYLWSVLGTLVALTVSTCAPTCERMDMQVEVTRRLCIEHAGAWSDGKCLNPQPKKP